MENLNDRPTAKEILHWLDQIKKNGSFSYEPRPTQYLQHQISFPPPKYIVERKIKDLEQSMMDAAARRDFILAESFKKQMEKLENELDHVRVYSSSSDEDMSI
jgi:hypothetical protein